MGIIDDKCNELIPKLNSETTADASINTNSSILKPIKKEKESRGSVKLKSVSNTFLRGNGEDYKVMNAIWKKVNESFKPYKQKLNDRECMIIRQRIFIILCREYLRIRSHPKRERDVSIGEFLKFGSNHIEKLCKVKAENFKIFQKDIEKKINAKYDEKIREYKLNKMKSIDQAKGIRYQYVYEPPNK